ncbi:MAG: GAF domain-containing protein [Bacteroidota bacterium]
MITIDLLNTELERLSALRRYDILDTPMDGNFNKMTSLASIFFDVPVAIISLVDHDKIWFKSCYGLELNQVSKDAGLCASAIMHDDIYVVEDASKDHRCLANPLVSGDFGLKFYAAAPLTTKDGHNLGTFCIIDKKPRSLSENQKIILQQMAEIVMDEMELRLSARNVVKGQVQRITELEEENKKLRK